MGEALITRKGGAFGKKPEVLVYSGTSLLNNHVITLPNALNNYYSIRVEASFELYSTDDMGGLANWTSSGFNYLKIDDASVVLGNWWIGAAQWRANTDNSTVYIIDSSINKFAIKIAGTTANTKLLSNNALLSNTITLSIGPTLESGESARNISVAVYATPL